MQTLKLGECINVFIIDKKKTHFFSSYFISVVMERANKCEQIFSMSYLYSKFAIQLKSDL